MKRLAYKDAVAMDLRIVSDSEALAEEAAKLFADLAAHAAQQQQRFTVALSGGSTPLGLFDRLVIDYRDRLDWTNIHIFWVDERSVPPTHIDSNFGAAKTHLLDKVPIPIANIHRIKTEKPLHVSAAAYNTELRQFFAITAELRPCFDLIILGIGKDGHTASLFPDSSALYDFDNLAVENYIPSLEASRITITFPVINAAACVLVLASGASKSSIVQAALSRAPQDSGFPIQRVDPQKGTLIWLADSAASSGL